MAGEIDAVVFDVIGTMVDEDAARERVAAGVAAAAGVDAGELRRRWTALLDARMDAVVAGDAVWEPHRALVAASAEEAVSDLGGTPTAESSRLAAGLDRELRAWPEVAEATAALRRARLVAAVSNGDLDALARVANASGISWDVVVSTGAVRTFKPAPAAYRYAIEVLDLEPSRTLFVAAHPWDLRAAASYGFRTAYVARPGAPRPAVDDAFDLEVSDLAGLVASLAG